MTTLSLASGAVACLFIGTAAYLVGFGSPYWYTYHSDDYRGLWQICFYNYECYAKTCRYNTYDNLNDDFLLSAQIITTCGLGFGLIALILGISWIGRPQKVPLIQATTAFSFIAGLVGTGGVAVYGAGVVSPNDFGYWLTVSGCVLYVISGIIAATGLGGSKKSTVIPADEVSNGSQANTSSIDCDADKVE